MITIDEFLTRLTIEPSSAAIEELMRAFPHAFDCRNGSQKLLLYVNAWTLCISTRGIALTIDDAISENYLDLLDSLEKIGARRALEYAQRAAELCGGAVPADELERAKLGMKLENEFDELDRIFNNSVREEAAEALVKRFSENLEKSFNELAARTD